MTDRRLGLAAIVGAGLLWSVTFILGKVALEEITPTWLIAWRFGLAALCLVPFVPWREVTLGRWELSRVAVGGTMAALVVFLLQFEGLALTTASSAALLVAVAPPGFALAAYWVDGERPTRTVWAAIALSVLGIGLLVGQPGPGRTLLGDALCVLSMLGAVAWTLLSRRIARRTGAAAATALQFAFGMGVLLLLGTIRGGPAVPASAAAWGAVFALGTACTALTFWLFTWGLLRVEAARAGVLANVEPAVGALLGVWLLGETLGGWAVVGGMLLIAAAILATRADPRS
ncbi:MAG: DMT family transporter [Bacteroidota bacterium]